MNRSRLTRISCKTLEKKLFNCAHLKSLIFKFLLCKLEKKFKWWLETEVTIPGWYKDSQPIYVIPMVFGKNFNFKQKKIVLIDGILASLKITKINIMPLN